MKAILEFLPIVLFFIFYKFYGLYVAIYAMIIASLAQVIWTKIYYNKYEKAQIIAFIAIIVFGGLTLWFRSPSFVMWKVSAINILFALILFSSIFIGKKTILERMLGKQMQLPKDIWRNITLLWGATFIVIAIINYYFVIKAITLRDKLISLDTSWAKLDLQNVDCIVDLCTAAQSAESAWVNFKLFGSLGITIFTMIITVIYVQKYHKIK